MLVKFINKDGNVEELDNQKQFGRLELMDKIGNMYFEKRDEEVVVEKIKKKVDYKKLLKDAWVKGAHLMGDDTAKAKCEELNLL